MSKSECVKKGLLEFEVSVSGPARELHSGIDGGLVQEPMLDLVQLLATLAEPGGKLKVRVSLF